MQHSLLGIPQNFEDPILADVPDHYAKCIEAIQSVRYELKDTQSVANPILSSLQAHLGDLFSQSDNKQAIEESFNKINLQVIKDMICHFVWQRRGRPEGLHPDFGRLSYLQSPRISAHYHMSSEERIEMILEMTEKISNN